MKIEDTTTISILSTALMHCLDIASNGKILNYKSIGFVHSTLKEPESKVQTWLIKFDTETCHFAIDEIENDRYPDGTVICWYSDGSALTLQTDIFGVQMTHQTFKKPDQK